MFPPTIHKPEMSAAGVADAVEKAIQSDKFDFILVNFANPDMVGHTGFLGAAITAVETVDSASAASSRRRMCARRRGAHHRRSRKL